MKPTKMISFITVLLMFSCIAVELAENDPASKSAIQSRVVASSANQPASIWSPIANITSSYVVIDAACDVNGHAHVLYEDASENLYHVEYDGATFSSTHYIGVLYSSAAICVVGTTVHVAWVSMNGHVQYTRRVGMVWELNQTIPGSVDAIFVAITANGTHAWALWREAGPPRHFMLAKGTGTSWTSETIVNVVADDYNTGTLLYRDGRLHVAWVNGNSLYYRCYSGTSIAINETVTAGAALNGNPSIALSATDVYIAYIRQGVTNGSYVSRSFVESSSWSAPVNFTRGNMYVYRMDSDIVYADGVLYFTWQSYRTTPTWKAQTHYITFNGTWSSMENLTVMGSQSPQLATSYEGVLLAFQNFPSGIVGLRFKYLPLSVRPQDDFQYVEGTTGNNVTWIVKGHLHSSGNYQTFKDGELFASATWSNGTPIIISVDGLGNGVHNYTIVAADASSNKVTDTAFVTVVEPSVPDMSWMIAAIVIPCAIVGGLLILFLLDRKKIIDLKKTFGKLKLKRQP
jgi:hypothetical protein